MSFIRQVLSITRMNLQSVLQRSGASIVIIVGIAGSVAVMVSLLAMGGRAEFNHFKYWSRR